MTQQLLGWNQAPGILCQPCFRSRRARAVPVLSRSRLGSHHTQGTPGASQSTGCRDSPANGTWPIAPPLILALRQLCKINNLQWGGCQSSLVFVTVRAEEGLEQGLQGPCAVPVLGRNSYRTWPAQGFIYAMPVLSHLETGPSKSTFGLSPHPNSRETSTLVIIFHLQERL